MSHRELFIQLKKKNKSIDIHGNIKIINPQKHKIVTAIYIGICVVYVINYIYEKIINIPYYPITLYSTNLYSKFAEQILILNKMNYQKIYHPVLVNPSYYLSSKTKTVNFNPNLKDFNQNVEIPFIPLSTNELDALSEHTGIELETLIDSQNFILNELPNINAYHICRENYLYDDDYYSDDNHVQSIKKCKNGYLVICDTFSFYTSIILSDYTFLLQPGEIISAAYTEKDLIHYENKYIVDQHYRLEPLSKRNHVLPCYTLDTPRDGLILHPFHLTKSKDLILSIMIITQALIDQL